MKEAMNGRPRDTGMVSAELAVALPAVLVVLVAGVAAVSAGLDQVRCVDAVGAAARLAARGEPTEAVSRAAAVRAPPGSSVRVAIGAGRARVEVRSPGPQVLRSWGSPLGCHAMAELPIEATEGAV